MSDFVTPIQPSLRHCLRSGENARDVRVQVRVGGLGVEANFEPRAGPEGRRVGAEELGGNPIDGFRHEPEGDQREPLIIR